jgi:hypothetical protein
MAAMPDPLLKTISATEAAALFDASPYQTHWMLYQRFAHGHECYQAEDARMDWGKKLEPLILAQAAQDLKFEIRPNIGPDGKQVYVRNGLLGCTRDAEIYCPDRGLGTCETKCIFDYRILMQDWDGGNRPPRHHEIQVQQQMRVGTGETSPGAGDGTPYKWGVEAVWCAGEVMYFERTPIPKFWTALEAEAKQFFDDVAAMREPEPFGTLREWPLLREVFPVEDRKILDLRDAKEGDEIAELVRLHEYHREQRLGHTKGEDAIKMKLAVTAKDSAKVLLPNGINFEIKKNKTGPGIKTYVPADLAQGSLKPFEGVDIGG